MSKNEYSNAVLASYVTYKELYSDDKYKSPYYIIAEFAKYIIYKQGLYYFSVSELKSKINEVFEFDLPEAVIRSSLKKIEFIKNDGNGLYILDKDKMYYDDALSKYKEQAENKSENVFSLLINHVESAQKIKMDSVSIKTLKKEFIAYLLDES